MKASEAFIKYSNVPERGIKTNFYSNFHSGKIFVDTRMNHQLLSVVILLFVVCDNTFDVTYFTKEISLSYNFNCHDFRVGH